MSKTFKQGDSRWASKSFAGSNMKNSGCGPTSVADIVVNNSKYQDITPWDVAQYMTKIGGASNGQGTYWFAITKSLEHYGFTVDCIAQSAGNQYGKMADAYWDKFLANLDADGWGILLMGKSVWTSGGHYIAITAVRNNNKQVYVRDPGARNRTGWYDVSTFKPYVKQFWCIKALNQVANTTPTTTTTTAQPTSKLSIDELAREVIAGKWGSNPTRKEKLIAAGYDYSAVQARVNEILKGTSSVKQIGGYIVGKSYTVQPSDGLNVRADASTSAKRITTLKKGTVIACTDVKQEGNNIWVKCSKGWCCAKYGNEVYLK